MVLIVEFLSFVNGVWAIDVTTLDVFIEITLKGVILISWVVMVATSGSSGMGIYPIKIKVISRSSTSAISTVLSNFTNLFHF